MNISALNMENLVEFYGSSPEPIPYTLQSGVNIDIYPILVKDALMFIGFHYLLTFEKNRFNDAKIIGMSYLDFLFDYIIRTNEDKYLEFSKLLQLNFHSFNIQYRKNEKNKNYIVIDGKEINSKDFDNIKRIILYRNIVGYNDKYIDPNVKKAQDEYNRLKNKDIEVPTFERQISIVLTGTGMNYEEVLNLPYRLFYVLQETINAKVEYEAVRAGIIANPLIEGKDKNIEHWIYRHKKANNSAFVTKESVENKFGKSMTH